MKAVLARTSSMLGIFALTAGILAVACSAPPAGSIGSGEQDQTDDGDKKLPTSSTSPTNPAPSNDAPSPSTTDPAPAPAATPAPVPDGGVTPVPSPADQQCAAAADMFACFDCCDAAHPGGWEVADQAWGDCVCQTACAQACGGNFCQGGQPSVACEQCLDNAQQCDQAADAACAADANCAASRACEQASACETKPQ
jgi:hypothetical protein